MIKENDLVELDFKRTHVTIEESGDSAFTYYTFEKDFVTLITNVIEDGNIKVFIFEDDTHYIDDLDTLKSFIDILYRFKKK